MSKKVGRRKILLLFLILFLFFLITSIFVEAQSTARRGFQAAFGGGKLWDTIKYIFTAGWIKDKLDFVATMRIGFFFFVFAVIFAVLRGLGAGPLNWLTPRIAGVLAFIMAAIGTLFMPMTLLIAMGADYAIITALIFMLPVIGLLIWAAISFWNTNRWLAVIAIIVLIFVWFFIVYMVGLVEMAFETGKFNEAIKIAAIPLGPFLLRYKKKWES